MTPSGSAASAGAAGGGSNVGTLAPVVLGGGSALAPVADALIVVVVVAVGGDCGGWSLGMDRDARWNEPSFFVVTRPAGTLVPGLGLLLADGVGGGGPLAEIAVRANWSRIELVTAAPAADVIRSANPA